MHVGKNRKTNGKVEHGREADPSEVWTGETAGIPDMLLTQRSARRSTFSCFPSGAELEAPTLTQDRPGQVPADAAPLRPQCTLAERDPRPKQRSWALLQRCRATHDAEQDDTRWTRWPLLSHTPTGGTLFHHNNTNSKQNLPKWMLVRYCPHCRCSCWCFTWWDS